MLDPIVERHARFIPLVFLILCLGLYANALNGRFLMDDYPMLVGNNNIYTSAFWQLHPSSRYDLYFRPVTHILNTITFSLFGDHVVPYHLTNLFLFYLSGILFCRLVFIVFNDRLLGVLSTLLFYFHPVNALLVNYKNATGLTFMCLAFLLSAVHFMEHVKEGKTGFSLLSVVWAGLALLCHEVMVVIPLYFFVTAWTARRGGTWRSLRSVMPYVFLVMFYLVARSFFVVTPETFGGRLKIFDLDLWQYGIVYGKLVMWYICKLLWPFDIVMGWSAPVENMNFGLESLYVSGFVVFMTVLQRVIKGKPELSVGMVWLGIGLALIFPAALSRPLLGIVIQTQWLSVASFGFFIFIAAIFVRCIRSKLELWAVCGLVLLALGWGEALRAQNRYWSDGIKYCGNWARINPASYLPRFWLAFEYMQRGQYARSRELFEDIIKKPNAGLRRYPEEMAEVYGNLGIMAYRENDLDQAKAYFIRVARLKPDMPGTYCYLGQIEMKRGRFKTAARLFRISLRLDPSVKEARRGLEEAEQKTGVADDQ